MAGDKKEFVRKLAIYLVERQANKSIILTVDHRDRDALEWAAMRRTTPLFGYPTVDEAVRELADWLGIDMKE